MQLDVSIIYVNYFTSNLIKNSIHSVINKTKDVSFEIIIVDNNTEKDIEAKLKDIAPEEIPLRFVFLENNLGYGGGNNEGAKIAKGKYLFLLNPDTLLQNNAIKILKDFIEENTKVGICGGNLFSKDNLPIFSFRKIFPGPGWDFHEMTNHLFNYPFNIRKQYFNFSKRPKEVAYISGADLMIDSKVFKKSGGFPNYLFMYWDDVALCKRVHDLGYKVYNVPSAEIIHLESQSFDNDTISKTWKIELLEKYRIIYLENNVAKIKRKLANIFYNLFLSSRAFLLPEGFKKKYYKLRKDYFIYFKNLSPN